MDANAVGVTPWRANFGEHVRGPAIPFGAFVGYKQIADKGHARLDAFVRKLLPGLFIGYEKQCGGGWSGDLLFVDVVRSTN